MTQTPAYIGDCFCIQHVPSEVLENRPAVVLCPPLFNEYFKSYGLLRQVAATLQKNGIPVIRFDYTAQGDSYGDPQNLKLDLWIENIRQIVPFWHAKFPAMQLTVVATRFSMALASHALRGHEQFESCALLGLDPVTDGTSYVEDLQRTHALLIGRQRRRMRLSESGALRELLGARYPTAFLESLTRLDCSDVNARTIHTDLTWLEVSLSQLNLPTLGNRVLEALL